VARRLLPIIDIGDEASPNTRRTVGTKKTITEDPRYYVGIIRGVRLEGIEESNMQPILISFSDGVGSIQSKRTFAVERAGRSLYKR